MKIAHNQEINVEFKHFIALPISLAGGIRSKQLTFLACNHSLQTGKNDEETLQDPRATL